MNAITGMIKRSKCVREISNFLRAIVKFNPIIYFNSFRIDLITFRQILWPLLVLILFLRLAQIFSNRPIHGICTGFRQIKIVCMAFNNIIRSINKYVTNAVDQECICHNTMTNI